MVRLNYNIFNSKESTFSIFFICLMAISCSTEEGTLYNKTRSSSSKISKNVQNTQDVISVENLEGEPGVDFEDKNGNLIPDNLEDGEWFEDVKPPPLLILLVTLLLILMKKILKKLMGSLRAMLLTTITLTQHSEWKFISMVLEEVVQK